MTTEYCTDDHRVILITAKLCICTHLMALPQNPTGMGKYVAYLHLWTLPARRTETDCRRKPDNCQQRKQYAKVASTQQNPHTKKNKKKKTHREEVLKMEKIPLRAAMRFTSPAQEERWRALSKEEQDLKLKKWAMEDALEDAYYNEIEEKRNREATEIYEEMTERWNALSEEEKALCEAGLLEL